MIWNAGVWYGHDKDKCSAYGSSPEEVVAKLEEMMVVRITKRIEQDISILARHAAFKDAEGES